MDNPEVPVVSTTLSEAELTDALDEAGCCIVHEAAPPEIMDALLADMEPFRANGTMGVGDFEGMRTRRTGSVVARSGTYRDEMALHPSLLAAGNHVLARSETWILSVTELIEILPGQPRQQLHRDQWKYDFVDLPGDFEVNAMWAVSDFTAENGATQVVPGSHRWDHDRRPQPSESVPAVMAKGSLLLYTGQTFHGGGANDSSEARIGLSLGHAAGWLAQADLIMLECPPEVVAGWDDELVRFVGYQRRSNSMGNYRDSEDPMVAVHPDRTYPRGWMTSDVSNR